MYGNVKTVTVYFTHQVPQMRTRHLINNDNTGGQLFKSKRSLKSKNSERPEKLNLCVTSMWFLLFLVVRG